ncbi:MAG: DUF3325 domain-containing protein [Caulobacterales bacterium]
MHETVTTAAALLSSLFGMAWLALAMRVHWAQVRDAEPLTASAALTLRIMGGLALALSWVLCLQASHATMAALVWIMSLAGAALAVAQILAWRPRLLAPAIVWLRPTAPAQKQ